LGVGRWVAGCRGSRVSCVTCQHHANPALPHVADASIGLLCCVHTFSIVYD
jgi:hypothetical protein